MPRGALWESPYLVSGNACGLGFLSQRCWGQLSLVPRGCGHVCPWYPCPGWFLCPESPSQGSVVLLCPGGRCVGMWRASPSPGAEAGPRR